MAKKSVQEPQKSVAARLLAGLTEFADALERGEPMGERFTCRTVDLEFKPRTYSPDDVRTTRGLLGTSQAVFARLLGVSVKTVQAWEQGDNVPSDMACRFMDEIRHDPPRWIDRLKKAASRKKATR